ncbi:hypothetical protein [Amycolatopsis sp. La24]|uniref:hypothetical protein n=1 Tax=Amycolatopsis sp. La24 TaxID=3028304 RepID=UPI0023AF4E96|nr:hypothetical protein [Amycolatopsis sp. La24]
MAEPLAAGEVGRALFDAVGPLLLIGWSDVGPGLVQALADVQGTVGHRPEVPPADMSERPPRLDSKNVVGLDPGLVERAKLIDAQHRERHQRPVSAEILRKSLGVGAERSRVLTRVVRADWREKMNLTQDAIA